MASIHFGGTKFYEPSPRFAHGAAPVGGRFYLWGGRLQDFSESGKRKLASAVEIFDYNLETWEKHLTTGVPPPGLYAGSCTSLLNSLYWFGGWDGSSFYDSLHRLDPTTLEWREVQPLNPADRPMKKIACGMVSFLQNQLATFGGIGIPTCPVQPGATFTKAADYTDGRGWSNELHLFNIIEGKWYSPPTTGSRPPPCAYFSFTAINDYQGVLFAGKQIHGRSNDCFLLNVKSMEWTQLEKPKGTPWPVERSAHAACCLNYGEEHPQLLVTGGVDKNGTTLQDAWILDVKSGRWRELPLPENVQPRIWHTATALSLGPVQTQVTMFGGCSKFEMGKSDEELLKLSKTTVLEFESVKSLPSGGDLPAREWILVGMAELEQRKTEHARMREIQELKEQLRQKKDEVASGKRQSRLALDRAIKAERESGKLAVLLSQTEANLEKQIQMKDQEMVSTMQQFNQTKAGLQRGIQARDQAISALQQQLHQMQAVSKHEKEMNKQAMAMTQQQMKALKHQIEVKEQARVHLEIQIHAKDEEKAQLEWQLHKNKEELQAKNEEKAVLEQQLHQNKEELQAEKAVLEQQLCWKEEQIQAKDREKAILEQQLWRKEEENQAKDREKAEMQRGVSDSSQVITQGEVGSIHQLLEARELRTREEEIRHMKDEHEAKLSRVLQESTTKQQQFELELKAQVREEINTMHTQVVALQRDRDDLQHQLSSKSQQNQDKIETLTEENHEMTGRINFLEAKLTRVEFLESVHSQEVDQLREELMEKIAEIDHLRKERKDIPADALSPSSTADSDKTEVQHHSVQTETVTVDIQDQQVQARSISKVQVFSTAHMRGAEVIAQKIFYLTQDAVELSFQGYGFKLHVPAGSLPAEVSETQLSVRVSLSGQFQMPPNSELLSAVYWVSSPYKFMKPITVEIQHCAALSSNKQCSQLKFVHTKCTQKELPYIFKEQVGGVFSRHSSYGSLLLSHFSGIGIVRRLLQRSSRVQSISVQPVQQQPQQSSLIGREEEGEVIAQHCAQVYTCKLVNRWKVDFVVTKDLDSCSTVVKKEYSSLGKLQFSFILGFEKDFISLDIPEKGLELKGWKITPFYKPKITKQQVLYFSSGTRIPKCELILEWCRDPPLTCLKHQIGLLGASDHSYFLLHLDPDADVSTSLEVSDGMSSPSSVSSFKGAGMSSKPLLKDLINAFYHKVADKWKVIGVLIEIPKGSLSGIAEKCRDEPQKCLVEMFEMWLECVYPPPTWAVIIEAVEFLGEKQLGKELRDKYCTMVNN